MIKKIIITILIIIGILGFVLTYEGLIISSNNWTTTLPVCPCESPGKTVGDGWAIDKGNISTFHKGASLGFRSYPSIETSEGRSGQQCCYNENGNLLTSGLGAGTPDRSNTCKGEDEDGIMIVDYRGVFYHVFMDVIPFFVFDIKEYHQFWTPDKGDNCNN